MATLLSGCCIGQFAVYSGQYAEYLAKRREEAEKKAAAKQKGGAK